MLSIVARPLITTLFGAWFAGAATAVPLLAVAAVAGGVWKVLGADVVAAGRTSPRLWSAAAGLVCMVAVDVVAIPPLGIRGAALGAALGYTVAALVLRRWWPWHRHAGAFASAVERASAAPTVPTPRAATSHGRDDPADGRVACVVVAYHRPAPLRSLLGRIIGEGSEVVVVNVGADPEIAEVPRHDGDRAPRQSRLCRGRQHRSSRVSRRSSCS